MTQEKEKNTEIDCHASNKENHQFILVFILSHPVPQEIKQTS